MLRMLRVSASTVIMYVHVKLPLSGVTRDLHILAEQGSSHLVVRL